MRGHSIRMIYIEFMTHQKFCRPLRNLLAVSVLLMPAIASAHPGFPGHTHGFSSGVVHPLSGLDHLLAMIAVGVFAAQRGGKMLWQLPLAFISLMAIGGLVGATGMVQVPFAEQAVAASVLFFGLLIASAAKLSLRPAVTLIGLFALFHGFAHGAEMPAAASGWIYGLGFLSMTAFLHACGVGIGLAGAKVNSQKLVRCVGSAIALCGIYLVFTA